MSTKKMSITDIAVKVGVSASTISRVINDRPGISDRTRGIVFERMSSFGYEPIPVSSRPGRKNLSNNPMLNTSVLFLAVISHNSVFKNFAYSKILHSIENELARNGISMIYKRYNEAFDFEDLSISNSIGGIIVFGGATELQLESTGLPIVSVFSSFTGKWDQVTYDKPMVAERVIEYIKGRGHSEFLELTTSIHSERIALLAAQNGLKVTRLVDDFDEIFIETELVQKPNQPALRKRVEAFLKNNPLPKMIFVHGDIFAVSLYSILNSRGYTAGKDFEIVSVNNEEALLDALEPRPATVDICAHDVGKAAVQRLIWRKSHPCERPVKLIFEPQLIESH